MAITWLPSGMVKENGENFRRCALNENFRRGRVLVQIVIAFKSIYIAVNIATFLMQLDSRFDYFLYLGLYFAMLLASVLFLVFMKKHGNTFELPPDKLKKSELAVQCYISFLMIWGSVVSLIDQRLYGQLMVFMVNTITCSVVFLVGTAKFIPPYAASVAVLAVGLPFFQSSGDVLLGHYINLSFFTVVAFIAGRILYRFYCQDYARKAELEASKHELEEQIERNRDIQNRLNALNNILEEMSLVDDLTRIPNRRGFRNFLETSYKHFSKDDVTTYIIIADIDFFKNYNDHYGHNKGDEVLKAVAQQLQSSVRDNRDFAARWGGEELIFVTYHSNDREIRRIAEDIRKKVMDLKIPHVCSDVCGTLTVSLGISSYCIRKKSDIPVLIEQADKAMYEAKSKGRNCVCFHAGHKV